MIQPSLLKNSLPLEAPMSLSEALAMTSEQANTDGATPQILLDFFVRASGLQWDAARVILRDRFMVPAGFSAHDVAAVRQARHFLEAFNGSRLAYAIAVVAQEVPALPGDWALLETAQLSEILPGLHVPKPCRRTAYLGNLVMDQRGLTLDLHAFPSALPLFQHPL